MRRALLGAAVLYALAVPLVALLIVRTLTAEEPVPAP